MIVGFSELGKSGEAAGRVRGGSEGERRWGWLLKVSPMSESVVNQLQLQSVQAADHPCRTNNAFPVSLGFTNLDQQLVLILLYRFL